MVSLVVKASGVAFVLFHVEHSPGSTWRYRWRVTGNYPDAYLQWREGESDSSTVILHPEIIACPVEAQWLCPVSGEWRQAALREAATGSCRFHIKAKDDFIAPSGFRAFSAIGDVVACYAFGPIDLRAGIETVIRGMADGPYPDNVLLHPGDFRYEDDLVSLCNEDPSEGSLVAPSNPSAVLSVVPGSSERRVFAVTSGRSQSPII